ncbi:MULTISPECIES: hypothetical protein [unclassified Blastococcus]
MVAGTASGACAAAAVAVVALVLVAEAGLLVGVVLPAGSLVLGLGVLAGAGAVPGPLAATSAAAGTVLGAALGHRAARRRPVRRRPLLRLPAPVRRLADRATAPWRGAVGRRPVRAAAAAQFVAGARTLAPRLAAAEGVPVATMLRGTVPAAVAWAGGLVAGGALAGAALPLLRDALPVAGLVLVAGGGAWLHLRRRGEARRP